jgi:outer membrane protein assembly factor BamD (BamD/ComL family)
MITTSIIALTGFSLSIADVQKTKPEHAVTERKPKNLYQKKFVPKKIKEERKEPKISTKNEAKEALLKKTIRDMTLEELIIAKEYAASQGYKELVVKYIKQMLLLTNDQEQLRLLRLELADLYFQKGSMKEAGKLYRKYVEFYPGSKQRDYAEYKAVLCRFYARLKPPLDQSKTRKAIVLANRYLDASHYKAYANEVTNVREVCYKDLFEYEMDIFHQYLKRDQLIAAQTRLESIKEEFIPVLNNVEPSLIELEGLVAQKRGNSAIATKKLDELTTRFPSYHPKTLLAAIKPPKSYVTLF